MCIIHKGFRSFQAFPPALISVGKLIGFRSAIPYEIIHSTLPFIAETNSNSIKKLKLWEHFLTKTQIE